MVEQDAGHAWAEAYVPTSAGSAFDPTNGICATDAHVRVAVGLDYLGAAPVRGTRYGGGGETLAVKVRVGPGHAASRRTDSSIARGGHRFNCQQHRLAAGIAVIVRLA